MVQKVLVLDAFMGALSLVQLQWQICFVALTTLMAAANEANQIEDILPSGQAAQP